MEYNIYNMKMAKLKYSHEVQYIQHENGKVNVQPNSTIYIQHENGLAKLTYSHEVQYIQHENGKVKSTVMKYNIYNIKMARLTYSHKIQYIQHSFKTNEQTIKTKINKVDKPDILRGCFDF